MDDRSFPRGRLGLLGEHLKAHKFGVELTGEGLRVTAPESAGCSGGAVELVVCARRPEDGGAWWFFTSWGEAIAPADRVVDAVVAIKGHLAGGLGAGPR